VLDGWEVDFAAVPGASDLGKQVIRIQKTQLVVGLANGWTTPPPDKFLLICKLVDGSGFAVPFATNAC
jgi:hypothetical protein